MLTINTATIFQDVVSALFTAAYSTQGKRKEDLRIYGVLGGSFSLLK